MTTEKKRTIGNRIKAWRESINLKQPDAATQLGIPFSTYQKYEMDLRAPGAEAMECFARAGINTNWLLTDDGPMFLIQLAEGAAKYRIEDADQGNGFVSIPVYEEIEASAGHGALPPDIHAVQVLKFSEEWIRHELRAAPSDLYLISVDGDSMEPTLRSGDVILIDHRVTHPNREGVYIMRMDGALLVKRLQFRPGGVVDVISDNDSYSSFSIRFADMADQDFVILGKVVWSGRRM